MHPIPRTDFLLSAGALAAGQTLGLASSASAAPGKPERTNLTIGVPVESMAFLPVYVAAAKTWKDQGLDVQLVSFRGDAEVAQALAGGSVDVSCASLTGLINLLGGGVPVIGFYAGFYQAAFAWVAHPELKAWADLKGRLIGVSTYGSLPDALTRYVLRRHGLDPAKDVQITQVGGSATAIAALKAGRIDAAVLYPPYRWQAADDGMAVLGVQTTEVAPQWPAELFMAQTSFLNQNPNLVQTLLRAHVAALRLAKSDRTFAVDVLRDRMHLAQALAERTYDATIVSYDERGRLPQRSMPTFWNIAVANHDVAAPLPTSKILDPRFIDTFGNWAPS